MWEVRINSLSAKKIIDITPLVSSKMAVFPGDTPFSEEFCLNMANGDNLTLSKIEMSAHIGAHADAPNHYSVDGEGIGQRSLHYYLGDAQVINVTGKTQTRILPAHFSDVKIIAKRILFRTDSFLDPNQWHNHFNSLSAETIDYLANHGVILVGIDTPSIDLADDKILESHQVVYKNNMAILEGLVLIDVPAGEYQLVALPLKIDGADASPVRAVLLK